MENILLAAGLAIRSNGRKLFLPWKGRTVIEHAVLSSLEAGLFTIVVTGYRHQEVEQLLRSIHDPSLRLVYNRDFRLGQGTSTRTGASLLHDHREFFISLADMPLLEARHYRWLADQPMEAEALRPVRGKEIGHPVRLASTLRRAIRETDGTFSMQKLLASHTMQTCPVDDDAYFCDIDTVQAYRNLLTEHQDF